ncbi:MobF family relaxase [Variovorax guangxiensis]|uniref:MobF family relaxase n=1 Tax=Variovorax guangxiensis TaxID=1775474 RepID=UPI00285655E8|nr:MobF family relaxase [Variovorax guangxiensis]MDR6860952.1 conjugative relaxase-like TrwC/TraI family protein [Variovorax guangxiensis]
MLSFKFVTSASGAAHYFETSDDYYGSEGHRGEWVGQGVIDLGLGGTHAVDRETFQNLLDGELPNGQRIRLSQTKGSKDRKGIDFTFSAPKSVSIQALVQGDERIIAAHDAAVKKSLELLQEFAATRKKQAGLSFRERTGKLVTATFRHELSRAQDPQLHTHAIVMNLTRRADGEWRALSNEDMLKNVKVVGAFYRATLAAELKALGYDLRETRKGGWELAHIPDTAIRHFSQRSREIEQLLAARGQDRENATTAQKQLITLATRRKKTESDRAWLRQHWLQTAREAGVDLGAQDGFARRASRAVSRAGDTAVEKLTGRSAARKAADEAIDFAIAHLAERQGIFSRGELLEVAYGRAATRTTTSAVEAALDKAATDGRLLPELPLYQTARSLNISAGELAKDPRASRFKGHDEFEKLTRVSWIALTMSARGQTQAQAEASVDAAIRRGALISAEARFATPEAKRSEIRLLAIEKAGRGRVPAVVSLEAVSTLLASSDLNAGQREAVAMVLTARDRFVGIQGLAGTGKSHTLSKAVQGIKAQTAKLSGRHGFRVIGLAPYASQNQALASLGMESQTLASFLARTSQHHLLDRQTIVFLDEAGVVPAHQLEKLMALIEKQDARLVLTGDRQQTHAVEAGKPFEQLQDAGMTKAFLTEIKRQNNETIRAAVVHAANNEVPAAVAVLRNTVVEVKQDARRHARIAEAYFQLPENERSETLIVAGTNDARRAINALVREGLALSNGDKVEILTNVDMTRAELRSAQSYEAGQVVVPQRAYGGNGNGNGNGGETLMKGEQLQVVSHDIRSNELTVEREGGRRFSFDPSRQSMLRVYERESVDLAPGDWVRVSANDKALGICNGERYQVAAVDATHVTLKGGDAGIRVDRRRPVHLQHGYASTIHSAQGLTKNRVLVDANTKSLTSNRAVFYVAISRPRNDITLFTDDASKLAAAMSREPKKFAALELRDQRNEAMVLKTKVDRAARSKLAAQVRIHPPTARPPTEALRVQR